jgi:glycosyltransferase involved in cell wall biosynthesis
MNRAKHFVFLPRWPEPQGRVVIEAALCGCELVTNQNVGATSFPFDIRNPANFAQASNEFWDAIEQLRP